MRTVDFVLVMLALGSQIWGAAAAGRGNALPPAPDKPEATLEQLRQAYADKSLEAFAALFTADYQFHTTATVNGFPTGFTREFEIRSASGLFHGVKNAGHIVLPAADSIALSIGGLTEGPDPEHPDSTQHYRLVAIRRFDLRVVVPGKNKGYTTRPALHVFHLVRGDAALRVEGQVGDAEHWYIRRWLEDVDALTLALGGEQGRCDAPAPEPVGLDSVEGRGAGIPMRLAIHALGSPACPDLDVQCDLPGTEPARLEVFDVMGRLVAHHDLSVRAPGTQKLQAGAGAHLHPGAYWLRLTQASRPPNTRMVVVAR